VVEADPATLPLVGVATGGGGAAIVTPSVAVRDVPPGPVAA
jgi:hypothetical protein